MSGESRSGSVELIAAVARNGVIGRGGQLPWYLPDDLKWFKDLTVGQTIIMGRRTFESVGSALPRRRNIIVSSTMKTAPADTTLVATVEEAVELARQWGGRICVVGGAKIYAAALPIADVLRLTELDEPVEGDTYFPKFDRNEWRVVEDISHPADERHAISFHFRTYERVKPN